MNVNTLLVVGIPVVASLQAFPALADDTAFTCVSPVQSFSNPSRMSKGDFAANVKWKEVRLNGNSVGYGPGEDHRYELTVLDGRVYMSRPGKGDAVDMRQDPKPDEGAAMLQVASPSSWGKLGELSAVTSFDDLNFELDLVVDDLGCGDDVLLPFKITGHAKSVTWSMDTQPSRVTKSNDQEVVIVGLYNRNDKSKYFMVKGYNIHSHVVMPTLGYAGHLRSVDLKEGAVLFLPEG